VLKPGGVLFAAGISRFASLLDGLRGTVFEHDAFARIVERDLEDGQHRNETGVADFFTTAYFHPPDELAAEVRESGFALGGLYAVEGPGAFVPDFARRWAEPRSRERLLDLVRRVEREPALLGASPHLLAVGRVPEGSECKLGAWRSPRSSSTASSSSSRRGSAGRSTWTSSSTTC